MPDPLSPGLCAQIACLLEATARKPGNVHRYLDFSDSHYLDFGLSALAIGPALDRAAQVGIGAAVLDAVRATRRLVSTNTNLGMILLLVPFAAVPGNDSLKDGIARVLQTMTIDDARKVYEAIRLARPGGLGAAPEQDVSNEPDVSLLDAMKLASERDSIARQYVNRFDDVLGPGLTTLRHSLDCGRSLETAIIATHLALLARLPDTLIARKRGDAEAALASTMAAAVLEAGWPDRSEAVRLCDELDVWLRSEGHERNPGTTADLVAAVLFAALRSGTIRLPIDKAKWMGPS